MNEQESPDAVAAATPAAGGRSKRRGETVKLDAELGIEKVRPLHQQLLARLNDADVVRIDSSEVERIHGAAMQLFCLFCLDRRGSGRDVEFVKPSEALRNAAALLGATTLLNLAKVRS